jgi:Rrf2 family cysteine metabolism transcriptional repressor
MRLSMKGDYGVRAVLDLAERYGQGPIQSEAIAKRQGISEAYLDQLLTLLRRAGLVRSVRGPRGGHQLTRPAGEISLMEVLTALEGSFLQVGPEGNQVLPSVRVQQEVWQKVRNEVQKIMESTSVHDLLEREQALTAPARYVI